VEPVSVRPVDRRLVITVRRHSLRHRLDRGSGSAGSGRFGEDSVQYAAELLREGRESAVGHRGTRPRLSRAGQRVPAQCGWRAALSTWSRPRSRCAVAQPAAPGCRAGSAWSAGSGERGTRRCRRAPGRSAAATVPSAVPGLPGRRGRKGMGRAGRYRRSPVSPGRLGGSVCSPGTAARRRSSSRPPSCPPAPGPPARHPRQGHTRLAARLCRDRADYAACLEHWPGARTGATVTCVSALMTSSSHYRTSATCCARPTATRSRSSGESPSRLRRPHSGRYLAVPLPIGACPGTLFPWVVIAPGSHGLRGIIPGNRGP
jgi:hypothetical protein